jgi:hypothetical protein
MNADDSGSIRQRKVESNTANSASDKVCEYQFKQVLKMCANHFDE